MQRILVVEDDLDIQELLKNFLQEAGYEIVLAGDGVEACSAFLAEPFDLVLLDVMLPKMNGFAVCELIRKQSQAPIIMLTALSGEEEQIRGLDLQVDDYITKPFGTSEMMARIRTALRHSHRTEDSESVYHCGDLTINFEKRLITCGDEEIHLTQIEYKLVSLLARQAGKVLTYDYLIRQIWGPYSDNNNQILRVNMAHIRRKLEKNPAEPEYIFTEIGVGYRMRED